MVRFGPLLETNLLQVLLAISVRHKKGSAKVSALGLQRTDAVLAAAVFAFELHIKIANAFVLEKILQDHHGLRTAVVIAFGRQGDLDVIVSIFTQLRCVSGAQGTDDVIYAACGLKGC